MRRLSFIIFFVAVSSLFAQSPHGDNFSLDCELCHSSNSWVVNTEDVKFNHAKTDFPLTGQHNSVSCKSCHESLKFNEANNNCFSCHSDIHQSSVGINCEDCHSTSSWLVTNIHELHEIQRFPLLGAHITADCEDCHISSSKLNFTPLGGTCVDCHLKDFQNTSNPNHTSAGFSTDCETCHDMTSPEWSSTSTTHTFFPLVGGHAIDNCFLCHSQTTYSGLSQDCITCHQEDYQASTNPNHAALAFPTDCETCHNITPGWQATQFPIHDNYYVLTGAHGSIQNDCNSCHSNGYSNTSEECFSCHSQDYNNVSNPPHASSGFSQDCTECHSTNAWIPSTFDHDNQFFPIFTGAHTGAWSSCNDCHTVQTNFAVFTCIDCHEHNQTEMNEEHAGISSYTYASESCFGCHPTGNAEGFNHNFTQFPLLGVHTQLECSSCHTAEYSAASSECVSCHQQDYESSVNPSHQTLGINTSCDECHTPEPDWQPALFPQHNNYYMLDGAHVTLSPECYDCHQGDYVNAKESCNDCHSDNYNSTTNPSHATLALSSNCNECHTTQENWQPAQFPSHNDYYMLDGAHISLSPECIDCHKGDYTNTSSQCNSCHIDDYNKSANPNHGLIGISEQCEICHSTIPDWSPADYPNHDEVFPLSGAHQSIASDCTGCHKGDYANNKSLCYDCHVEEYNSASAPNHIALSIPTECLECHTADPGWSPAQFTIHNQYFELLGAHALIANNCQDCHNDTYTNNKSTCYECHNENYNNTTSPPHNPEFPTECETCHSQTAWIPATFDHNQFYPLLGAHSNIGNSCSSCHNSTYTNTPTTCFGCHDDDYRNVTDPQHDPGFPTDCESCHSQSAWIPSSFDHNQLYPLLGAHANIQNNCSSCHNSTFTNTPTTCFGCHDDDYRNVTDPQHDPGFPTDCESCHSQNAWTPSTFNHDGSYFPIYSGEHRNEWNACSDCHDVATNYSVFTCINCHEHSNQAEVNSDHNGVSGYVYSRTSCYDCHPNGTEGDINLP